MVPFLNHHHHHHHCMSLEFLEQFFSASSTSKKYKYLLFFFVKIAFYNCIGELKVSEKLDLEMRFEEMKNVQKYILQFTVYKQLSWTPKYQSKLKSPYHLLHHFFDCLLLEFHLKYMFWCFKHHHHRTISSLGDFLNVFHRA